MTDFPQPKTFPRGLPFLLVGFVALSAWRMWPGDGASEAYVVTGPIFGTTYSVKVVAPEFPKEKREAIDQVTQRALQQVDQAMSTYKADSELSKFNAAQSTEPFTLSGNTYQVFDLARSISDKSKGAFDVTVGPLVDAWGFGPNKEVAPPSSEVIAELRERVGYQLIELGADKKTVTKKHPELRADLSAIAKGFAVDHVAAGLRQLAYTDFMVEVGGEIYGAGLNDTGKPWQLAVEQPDAARGIIHTVVGLENQAMATSGDYRNFYMKDGKRISHTINPATGRPIEHNLASVTVIHESCAAADGWATALNVLGPTAGFEIAEAENIAALMLIREKDGTFSQKSTPAFDGLHGKMGHQ